MTMGRRLRGQLIASYGLDLERRETTSALATAAAASAAVNAGFSSSTPEPGRPVIQRESAYTAVRY